MDGFFLDKNLSRGDGFQSSDTMKQRRFSAATCTEKHKKFSLCGLYFNAVEHGSLAE